MEVSMKILKIIGLFCLFCFTFIYTDKIIDVTMEQDEIMVKIKEYATKLNTSPTNAIINEDTITPGSKGLTIDTESSYKAMKKIGTFNESLLIYKPIYPEISIYNNYQKYITNGNTLNKSISLIYIIHNDKTINNVLSTIKNTNTQITFFIDSTYLTNNISIIDKIKNYEIYNYGALGKYTKDNLIISNNIINNKSNNKSIYCLFLEKDPTSLNNCANNLMLSIIPINTTYLNTINNLSNGNIILINNTKELNTIINHATNKGFKIVPLSNLITE